ncbi:putative ribonuclease H-like domain-containing protein [Tanacetum coccineum]
MRSSVVKLKYLYKKRLPLKLLKNMEVVRKEARALQEEEEEKQNLEAAREFQRQLDQRHENRHVSIAQARRNMITYLKNQGGYKESYFKKIGYDDIRPIFKRVWDYVNTFIPKGSEVEKDSSKPSERETSKTVEDYYVIRPKHPRLDIVRPKASNTPIKRSYFTQPVYRPKDLKTDVKTFGVKNITTAGSRAVVSKGKVENVLEKANWVWRPKGNPEILLQDHAVVDSGCSSHMTSNKAYLSEFEDLNGGFVAFESDPKKNSVLFTESECLILSPSFKLLDESQVVLRAPRKDGVYNLDLKNIVPSGGLTCLYANATTDESKLWHRRLGKSPSISFMRPFGCPLTILNTLDSLGKFDGKFDECYLLGYSTSSKAYRVYNKRTKRVEENLHINFLEDQPNVTGTGPNWMFDLDFLTNSMNYIPVSVENQVNVDACTQDSYVVGSSGKDKGSTQEYILLPLQPHRTRIPAEDVAPAAHEKPSESSPKANDIQDSEDAADKEEQHQMKESEQVLQDELGKMVTQELAAKAMNNVSIQAFEEENRRIASQKKAAQATSTNKLSIDRQYVITDMPSVSTDRPFVSTDRPSVSTDRPSISTDRPFVSTDKSSANTPYVSAASTPTCANASKSLFVYLGGKIHIDASTLPNADLPIDPNMPDLKDASDTLPTNGIFNRAYDDDDDVGAVADFNNMDNTIAVSPIPTLRIHKDHPKGQILGDPTSAVPTRGKLQKASSAQQALACRQGFRQEEGIDYDDIFAPVARIEAIRIDDLCVQSLKMYAQKDFNETMDELTSF